MALSTVAMCIAWAGVAAIDNNLPVGQHNVVPRVGDNLDSGPSGNSAAGPVPHFSLRSDASAAFGELPRHLAFASATGVLPGDGFASTDVLTVETDGGSASFTRVVDGVDLLWALPHDGHNVTVDDDLRVSFRSDDHESVITVGVVDDDLVHDVTEQARSGS